MLEGQVLSAPQGVIWDYIKCFQEILQDMEITQNKDVEKRKASICLHLAVLIVETFFNIYFRLAVESNKHKEHKRVILKHIEKRKSLDFKIREWPKLIFRKSLDFENGKAKDFIDLKEKRNSIMHYKYTYDFVSFGNMSIHGLTDISFYESLNKRKGAIVFSSDARHHP